MTAPAIWIFAPGLLSLIFYTLRRWERPIQIAAIFTTTILALIAWQLPLGEPISLRLWPGMPVFQIENNVIILGRQFLIDHAMRPQILFVYISLSLWFGGAIVARVDDLFIPLGLGAGALITAALSISPILFKTLFFQMVVLACIPILSPPRQAIRRGVIRFLAFQTIGMSLILLSDWLLPAVEITTQDTEQALQSIAFLGLGIALIDAVFPFHTWMPMLAERAHQYAIAFVFFLLPSAMALIIIEYLANYEQFSISPLIYTYLQFGGAFMVLIGGLWSLFQNHLGRILAFAILMQIGNNFVVISLAQDTAFDPLFIGILYAFFLPQGLALAIWALALQTIRSAEDHLRFRQIQGIARRMPIAASSLIVSNLSLAGIPLLASFPVSLVLWSSVGEQSLTAVLLILVGNASLIIAALRTLAVLIIDPDSGEWVITERGVGMVLLLIGCLAILLIGLLPQVFLPPLVNSAFIFSIP